MRRFAAVVLALGLASAARAQTADHADPTIATYHASPDRAGHYVVPGLTWQVAANLHRDTGFDARVDGAVYAQPLYWHPPGRARGVLIVATEQNRVYALDAATGQQVWARDLGPPAPGAAALPCGDISPLGITGTPVIDPASRAVFLDAMIYNGRRAAHFVYGLSLESGAVLPGWPVDVDTALRARGIAFYPADQNQRGALALADGRLYVPYGGHWGDCGRYHGWVVGLTLANPGVFGAWATTAPKGGIWAVGGVGSDGHSLFATTGNTEGARQWGGGEAVIQLDPALRQRSYFAPANWKQLDDEDLDLGGTAAIPIDVPAGNGITPLMIALGKDGNAYLLNRANLGGIGHPLLVAHVANQRIITGPAAYRVGDAAFVAFQGFRLACPGGGENGVAALSITAGPRLAGRPAWCGAFSGTGSPVVTTSDGASDPIVWVAGANGDERLHGFRGDTGQVLFAGGPDRMAGIAKFATILAADGRLYIAGGGRVYAFGVGKP
jgi:outer membrane protein assembly factor BamB